MIGVDGASVYGGNGIFHISAFVQRIGMDGYLYIVLVGCCHRGTDGSRCASPVFVNLDSAGAGYDLFVNRFGYRAIPLAQQADVHGQSFCRLEHLFQAPSATGDGGSVGSVGRSYTSAYQGGDTIAQAGIRLLGGDEVHMSVYPPCGKDKVLATDGIGRCSRNEFRTHAIHGVGVSSLAYAGYLSVLDAYIRLYHAQFGVDDGHVGNDQIERALFGGDGVCQSHAVAYGLSASVYRFVAIHAEVFFYFYIQVCIAQSDFVAYGWAEQVIVFLSGYGCHNLLF